MARPTKRSSASSTKTKVESVTSIKLALSVLALGFSSLAAAVASTPVQNKPDLVVRNVSFLNNGLDPKYGDLVFEIQNIGNAATPKGFQVLLQSSNKSSFGCGIAGFVCKVGARLPEVQLPGKTTASVFIVPASFTLPPNSSVVLVAKVPLSAPPVVLPNKVDFKVHIDTTQTFAESSTANNTKLLTVPGSSLYKVDSASIVDCGDVTGSDATYTTCAGDTITHTPTGLSVKLNQVSNSDFVGAGFKQGTDWLMDAWLFKSYPLIVSLSNGKVVKITTAPTAADPTHFVTNVATMTSSKKGDITVADGTVNRFVGDTITHSPSGAQIKLESLNKDAQEQIVVRFKNLGAAQGITLLKNNPIVMAADNGQAVRLTYLGPAGDFKSLDLKIETLSNLACGNSTVGDGVAKACQGATITHSSGLVIVVDYYSFPPYGNYANLSFKAGTTELGAQIQPGQPATVKTAGGKKVKISFDSTSEPYVLALKLETL